MLKIEKCFFITILVSNIINSQGVTKTKFGEGMINVVAKDSSWSVKFAPRMQFLSTSSWNYDGNNYENLQSNFLIRRARLKFSGFAFSPKLKYKLELGLSNRDISGGSKFTGNTPRYILDAVVKWNFYKNFELWVGQTKLPGNVERVISSGNLQLVDRSLLNSRFNIDRDVGLQLRHTFVLFKNFVVREKFAISQGEGRNITTGNLGGQQYTTRLEMLPLGLFKSNGDYKGSDLKREKSPKLALGITYDFNNNAVKTRSNMGSYMENDIGFYQTDITTFFADAMFKYNGFSFMGEYASRDAKDAIAINSNGTPTGDVVQVGNSLNLQTGYLFKTNWEVSGRFTNINWDKIITGKSITNQYTLGVSKYIVGHKLKVQSDISYNTVGGDYTGILYRLQLDVHF
jgi:phosphate-selective porin OprO and OprP